MTCGVDDMRMRGISTNDWKHIGGDGPQAGPFVADRRDGETRGNLFRRRPHAGETLGRGVGIEAHVFHRAARDEGAIGARHEVPARSVGNVAQPDRMVFDKLSAAGSHVSQSGRPFERSAPCACRDNHSLRLECFP